MFGGGQEVDEAREKAESDRSPRAGSLVSLCFSSRLPYLRAGSSNVVQDSRACESKVKPAF